MNRVTVSHIVSSLGWGRLLTLLALLAGMLVMLRPAPAEAHCDAINGPVVKAAQKSLATGNVRDVLAYVPADAEAELIAAFKQTLEVRRLGGKAKGLADYYFYETAVRLHREGEGAAYTGLDLATDHGPALEAAGATLAGGKLENVAAVLEEALHAGLEQRYQAVLDARSAARRLGTLEAERERAEAELMFEKYVFELYTLAGSSAELHEGAASHPH